MSSPYAILGDRPLDQWKVTELKEELKRRKLPTKGLKEHLVKRLDEAVRIERQSTKNVAEDIDLSGLPSEEAKEETFVSERDFDFADTTMRTIANVADMGEKGVNDGRDLFVEAKVVESDLVQESDGMQTEIVAAVEEAVLENEAGKPLSVTHTEEVPNAIPHPEVFPASDQGTAETQNGEVICPKSQVDNDELKSTQLDSSMRPKTCQVSEANSDSGFEVTSNSVATETISVIEKNELNLDVITGNNQLELDGKVEIVQSSPRSVVPDSVDVPENMTDAEIAKRNDTRDLGSEKPSLDRILGADSMEEDLLDIKQVDAEPELTKGNDGNFPNQLEDGLVDVVGHDNAIEADPSNADKKTDSQSIPVKRKLLEPTFNGEPVKKARRWNTVDLKSSELQNGNALPATLPKTLPGSSVNRSSGNNSADDTEQPKERIVPPSSKPPTNSLRIDRFLRPFTNKAVQELLGRTGTVTDFWMDQIKTHCYVSYSSIEEAEKTRDAVYNLQWPPNGGRLLMADFVDPQEVKARLDAPPPTPATNIPPTYQPHPYPKPTPLQTVPRQQPPVSSVPPPVPFSGRERWEHPARDQPLPANDQLNLPPPPPLPEKAEPPILTLDDFFQKTNSSPRIYYLPLSDEQVAAKMQASGKNTILH